MLRLISGLFSIIIQLAVADFILLGTSIGPELWSYNIRTWIFGRNSCIAYRGLSIFATTASLYLTITMALHSLSTANIEKRAMILKNKKTSHEEDEEMRSSRHSLVACSDISTPPRTMNLDYRLANARVRVAPPCVFVWILAASLSIPEFALATTVPHEHDIIVCTLTDNSHRINMHSMVALFTLFLPALILTSAGTLIICHLISKKMSKIEGSDIIPALKLSVCLIFIYIIFCAPRSVFYVYSLYATSENNKIYLGYDNDTNLFINLLLSAMYLAATLLRPLVCISVLPRLRIFFSFSFRHTDDV